MQLLQPVNAAITDGHQHSSCCSGPGGGGGPILTLGKADTQSHTTSVSAAYEGGVAVSVPACMAPP